MYDLNEFNIKSILIKPLVSKSGVVFRYSNEDIEKIKNENLDILTRCGSGIQRGKILNIFTVGIISFHHADNYINRGGPPGFWEVYNKEKVTGFIIQILKDELDGGDVLVRGNIHKILYLYNQAALYTKSNIFMHKAIESINENNFKMNFKPKKTILQ